MNSSNLMGNTMALVLQSNMNAPDKFSMEKEIIIITLHTFTLRSTCRVAIKSSKLEVNLHNEEMKGNEMTANYL